MPLSQQKNVSSSSFQPYESAIARVHSNNRSSQPKKRNARGQDDPQLSIHEIERSVVAVENSFECQVCAFMHSNAEIYSEHIKRHPHLFCHYCSFSHPSKNILLLHVEIHPLCRVCGKRFSSADSLFAHTRQHHDLRCARCSFTDTSASVFSEHICECRARSFKCKYCHFVHCSEEIVKLHVNAHNLCLVCDMRFVSENEFTFHMRQHPELQCAHCAFAHPMPGIVFEHQRQLHQDVMLLRPTEEEPLPAEEPCAQGSLPSGWIFLPASNCELTGAIITVFLC
jgi:hypothetical protein